ncbi:PTS system, mannose-specific IID component [Clostridium amylolyticum]|uniref:PTS system, mannose-specific IID component n=1 Tax=Clostridium amylolyticum TaxID=1121298 RepID=A0A1M6LP67_9CLOT|nr:PTS system mannose/fructose/sorbose family transporter subunit IID [Clostridium amylolyticum]SHJ72970.1 PTS system, mannose-specific IID component [Clostridium amylolyticum]
MEEQKISKKELNDVFWRSQLIQMSHNYERMQSLGTLYCLKPILKKLYKDKSKEEKTIAMKRHLEFFNSHPVTIPFILGVTSAMEEKTEEDEKDSVISIKTSLMGPLAGIGDSLLNFTWMPICGSIGAAFAVQGNILGPILMFILVNALYIPIKYYGLNIGYSKGREILSSGEGKGLLDRLANMANVLGVIVAGGLIATTVKVSLGVQIAAGEKPLMLQEMLDKVMPNLLPLAITMICLYLLKKWNGKHAVAIIFSILIIAVVLSMAGILV